MPRPGDGRCSLRLGSPPGGPIGCLDTDEFLDLARTAKELGLERMVLTTGQRLMLPGLTPEQEAVVRARFGHLVVEGHDLVQACPGAGRCPMAKGDTSQMGRAVEALLRSMDLPAKVKAGVSGCANCCAESRVRDLGFIAGARGWTVVFGGNAGKRPRAGTELGRELTASQALDLARRTLETYADQARAGERTARYAERMEEPCT